MRKIIFVALFLGFLVLLPNISSAECGNIGGFDRFTLEGTNTIVLYSGSTPVARFDVQNCTILPSSKIEIVKSDVCDGDVIMIDGNRCTMMEIKPIGP